MNKNRVGPEHLSPKAREYALAEYARQESVRHVKLAPVPPGGAKKLPPGWKNEHAFKTWYFANYPEIAKHLRWVHQGMTLRLDAGHKYTADWVAWDGAEPHLFEVKGPHRFPSERSARVVFNQVMHEHPNMVCSWWRKTRDGYVEE